MSSSIEQRCEDTKVQDLERTIKHHKAVAASNLSKVVKLEQELQAERKKQKEYEEKVKAVNDITTVQTQQEQKGDKKEVDEDALGALRKKEEELEEALQNLQETEERLREQETKREETQRNLDLLKKAVKKGSETPTKSAEDLDAYFDQVIRLSEELSVVEAKCRQQEKEISKLKRVEKRAEELEEENVQAATKLSETEGAIKMLQTEVKKAQRLVQKRTTDGGETTDSRDSKLASGGATNAEEKLKRTIRELNDKLAARDEEVKALKLGDHPFSKSPTSPTDSMTASLTEITSLKHELKEKEQEIRNLRVQVGSVEEALQQERTLKKEKENLTREIARLSQEKQALADHSKRQSHHVLELKEKLKTSQVQVLAPSINAIMCSCM